MEALETASLSYRRPEIYAALTDDGAPGTAAAIAATLHVHGMAGAFSVLDIGCGTGAVLEELAKLYPTVVGVDLLPGMVELASVRRPDLDIRQGDMRTVRLGREFDVVTCVGNALAYLIRPDDIAAAFSTFAEHCLPGGVLLVQTLVDVPELDVAKTSRVCAGGREAEVTTSYSLDPADGALVMTRSWVFADGDTAVDVIRRRVLAPDELGEFAVAAGFRPGELRPSRSDRMMVFTREEFHQKQEDQVG